MNKNKLILIALAAVSLLTVVILTGCDEMPYEGEELGKTAPSIFWSDVVFDSLNSSNPVLTWYSTDPDGKVLDYQFIVLAESTVLRINPAGAAALAESFPDGYEWTITHEDSATIHLFASRDTSQYLPQYVFLKAMDDDSLFSGTLYKFVSRKNHPPTCYVVVPWTELVFNGIRDANEPIDPQWCLPETTASWKGIHVTWVGKDSIDISGLQPDFEWQVRVYGPFPDSASCDTVGPYGYLYDPSRSDSSWIMAKEYYFKNLETGWNMVYVRCRDDAFVPSIPALGYLNVYEPTWIRHPELTKKILLANHTIFFGDSISTIPGELPNRYSDSMLTFYENLIQAAGYNTSEYTVKTYTVGNNEFEPLKSDLYDHELVIVLDTDWRNLLQNQAGGHEQQGAYAKYLNVGGKLWVIGRRSFLALSDAGRKDFALDANDNPLPVRYLNLSAEYALPVTSFRSAEFSGAFGAMEGFPNIDVDTFRVAHTSTAAYRYSQALLHVDYLIRLDESETIYKFKSLYPDTSRFHNFPTAIRYEVPGSFKTSYFSFPLYFIQTDQAELVTRKMLEWFFED